jgi:hypothetical protein
VPRARPRGEEADRSDDGLACAEERLAAKRAAELEKRAKTVKQQLPVITARLGILWSEVTGSSRPMPSEIQLTSTGIEMTAEEHVATAETHLRYADWHLQPSEKHLADAEVHLKLVKAHLAALVAIEPAGADPPEVAAPPPLEPASGETSADQAETTPEEMDRSPAARPRVRSVQRGSESGSKGLHPGVGEDWTCPVSNFRIRQPTHWMSVESSGTCRSPRGGRRSRSGIAACAASRIAGIGRLVAGATTGSGFGGTTY